MIAIEIIVSPAIARTNDIKLVSNLIILSVHMLITPIADYEAY